MPVIVKNAVQTIVDTDYGIRLEGYNSTLAPCWSPPQRTTQRQDTNTALYFMKIEQASPNLLPPGIEEVFRAHAETLTGLGITKLYHINNDPSQTAHGLSRIAVSAALPPVNPPTEPGENEFSRSGKEARQRGEQRRKEYYQERAVTEQSFAATFQLIAEKLSQHGYPACAFPSYRPVSGKSRSIFMEFTAPA